MASKTKEKLVSSTVWVNALKQFGKCLLSIFFAWYFLIALMFYVSPETDAKIFNFLGLQNAEEKCYMQIYDKTGSNADLYNLIVFEGSIDNYKAQIVFLNELFAKKDYDDFCTKLDLSTIIKLNGEDKELVAYTCNSRSFLLNQKVECLFELNENVSTFIYSNLQSDYIKESSFATYVNFIKNSNLSSNEKIQEYQALIGTGTIVQGELVTVGTLVNKRIENIKNELEIETNFYNKVNLRFALMNLCGAKYTISKTAVGEWEEQTTKAEYENAIKEYNKLFA